MIVKTISYLDNDAPKKLTKSLIETGFSVLRDHPISLSLIEDVYKQWKKFFNSKNKNNYLFDSEKQDGFFPFGDTVRLAYDYGIKAVIQP